MVLTSAQAAKLLKKLNEEYTATVERERQSCCFRASLGEDPETVRPEYDYKATGAELEELERKIRKLKHALNVFNTTHTVPGFDMTVDEMLVYIPQLTKRKEKLAEMRAKLPKARLDERLIRSSNIIDYVYVNYDINDAKADFEQTSDELSRAQIALDTVNNTATFETEL